MEKENIHAGHRERLRQEFAKNGFEDWQEHKVLELLLQDTLKRVDTNDRAHRLINACGSFPDVFRASREHLESVEGIGKKTSEYIWMLGEFLRYYNKKRYNVKRMKLDSENCREYLLNLFDGKKRENFFMICLDAENRIIYRERIFEGGFDSVDMDITKIMRSAVQCDASYVLLTHNHPSGIAKASQADITSTQTIERTLFFCDIKLFDHIIVADGKCISMREEGYLKRPL